jgi:hypothetical protein
MFRAPNDVQHCCVPVESTTHSNSRLLDDFVDECCITYVTGTLLCRSVELSVVGDRLNDFVVGLANIAPTVGRSPLGSYAVCGRWPGPAPNGQRLRVRCNLNQPPARYVIILTSTANMNFCELEVYDQGILRHRFLPFRLGDGPNRPTAASPRSICERVDVTWLYTRLSH